MLVSQRKIINLPVKTRSGQLLGRVKDLEIQTDTCLIVKFIVSKSILVKGLLGPDLIIDRSQVVEINENEVVVEDGLIGDSAVAKEAA